MRQSTQDVTLSWFCSLQQAAERQGRAGKMLVLLFFCTDSCTAADGEVAKAAQHGILTITTPIFTVPTYKTGFRDKAGVK